MMIMMTNMWICTSLSYFYNAHRRLGDIMPHWLGCSRRFHPCNIMTFLVSICWMVTALDHLRMTMWTWCWCSFWTIVADTLPPRMRWNGTWCICDSRGNKSLAGPLMLNQSPLWQSVIWISWQALMWLIRFGSTWTAMRIGRTRSMTRRIMETWSIFVTQDGPARREMERCCRLTVKVWGTMGYVLLIESG